MTKSKFVVTCVGTHPIMFDRMTDETLEALRRRLQLPTVRGKTVQEEAEVKLYRNNGHIGIPADNFWSCLVEGGTLVYRKGKTKISTKEESDLPGLMDIEGEFIPIEGSEWEVDKRRGCNSQGKSKIAICIIRPKIKEWSFKVTLTFDSESIDEKKVLELVETAGRFKGLGAFRKKGRFGRFMVVNWEKV